MFTAEQIKAARALLCWDQMQLAIAAEVGIATLRRIEAQSGRIRAHSDTIWRVTKALEDAGIIFLFPDESGNEGVRLKKRDM
jgi:transcriptional regulator with XRE-family HTH domain